MYVLMYDYMYWMYVCILYLNMCVCMYVFNDGWMVACMH